MVKASALSRLSLRVFRVWRESVGGAHVVRAENVQCRHVGHGKETVGCFELQCVGSVR